MTRTTKALRWTYGVLSVGLWAWAITTTFTVELGGFALYIALVLWVVIALPIGVTGAVRRHRELDLGSRVKPEPPRRPIF